MFNLNALQLSMFRPIRSAGLYVQGRQHKWFKGLTDPYNFSHTDS